MTRETERLFKQAAFVANDQFEIEFAQTYRQKKKTKTRKEAQKGSEKLKKIKEIFIILFFI